MSAEIIVAVVSGGFAVLNTIIAAVLAITTSRVQKSVREQSEGLARKIEETRRVAFVWGEAEAFDALTRLTLEEKTKIRVTRFNPRKIQRQRRYFEAILARITGTAFEEQPQTRLERYNRLTSLNSEENKQSLIEQVELFQRKGCENLVLRITADKNDFELVICERSRKAALCFHDIGTQNLLHSCLITTDDDLFRKFADMYEKIWNEDILLEIDFSLGREHGKPSNGRVHLPSCRRARAMLAAAPRLVLAFRS